MSSFRDERKRRLSTTVEKMEKKTEDVSLRRERGTNEQLSSLWAVAGAGAGGALA